MRAAPGFAVDFAVSLLPYRRLLLVVCCGCGLAGPLRTTAAPAISSQPQKAVVTAGSNHTFSVTASGVEPLQFQWLLNEALIPGATAANYSIANAQTNHAGAYQVVVSDVSGSTTSSVARLVVRLASDPLYSAPPGGWTYIYSGDAVANPGSSALDGTWNHDNGSDSWSGDGRGPGIGLVGGLSSSNGVLTIEDAIVSGTSSVDNRRYYFTHNLVQELSPSAASWILNDGVTLSFRARLTPPPPADPLTELTNAPNGFVNVLDGKGMFGIRQAGGNGLVISFSLGQAVEDSSTTGTFNFGTAGLHMNNLNGDVRSAQVDPGDGGAINLLPLDPSVFHEFWITIADNGASPGTHRVAIYMDGSKTPAMFDVTAGSGLDAPFTNYIAMGLPSTGQRGAYDVDFFGYKAGVVTPSGLADPVEIVAQPTNQLVGAGQTASFRVQAIGTAPFAYQWFRNGSVILDATNAVYTTPPVSGSDHGAQFVVTVSNLCGVVTSAPPAILSFLMAPTIVAEPADLAVTNGSPASFSVGASGGGTISYQWRFNGGELPGETNSALTIVSADPSHAGGYDVVVANSAGSTTSRVAVLTVRVLDLGDAPPPYATLRASGGAEHVIANGIYLGTGVDFEVDGLPHSSAQGDDLAATDDEDGVAFTSAIRVGQLATVEVVASAAGLLNTWIDFADDGNWSGAGEQVFTNVALVAGVNQLAFRVPMTARAGETYARFRFNTAGGLAAAGPAADGEVEDYAISVAAVADLALTMSDSPDPVAAGSNVVYMVTVANNGPSPATGVTFADTLPANAQFVSATPSAGACVQFAGTLNCDLGSVSAGGAVTIAIVLRPTATGTLNNSANVSGNEFDSDPLNNSAATTTTVEAAPAISAQPVSLTVTQNHAAVFSVTAAGTEPLGYQWRFGETNLTGQTAATLSIPNAQPIHAGTYSVLVTNRVGMTLSAPATLTVLEPPTITEHPASSTNTAGSSVSLRVSATGTAPLSYQWQLNGAPISGATASVFSLPNAQKNNSGNYRATVSNSAGSVTSAVAQLTILEVDFGDAPDGPYPTLFASNGARHIAQPGVFLGTALDIEANGQPSSNASGDDVSGLGDEDGVIFKGALLVGQIASVDVIASTNGVLNAWFDFAGNGLWADAGDQIFTNVALLPGTNQLSFRVPANATSATTFARFRFSTAGGLSFFGEAADGEVEDYAVRAGPAVQLALALAVAPPVAAVGSNITYEITITNQGPSTANNVLVTDPLPGAVTFVSAVSSAGSCSATGGVVNCAIGIMDAGSSATVRLTVVANADGSITNSASVTTTDHDLFVADNTATVVSTAEMFPVIVQQPSDQTVIDGGTASFSVAASGTALQYQWLRNGTNLPGATSHMLVIGNANPSHEGAYALVVSNRVGSVTSVAAQLRVLVPPAIVTQPQSRTVFAGATANFSVQATGTDPLSYQWIYNGGALDGETRATLAITNVQAVHEGSYVVSVSNAAGVVQSDAASLIVILPPQIVAQPQSTTNFAGSTAVLTATATGTEPLSYQWYFNTTNALPGTTLATLTLPNVQTSNSGVYHVVVTNLAGSTASQPASLVVREADFGDAPDIGYPTLLSFNGARHLVVPGVHLGSSIDFDGDGIPTADATGDDTDGTDDEDGVTLPIFFVGQTATLQIVASTNGFVSAWIDFNGNGTWSEPGEQVLNSRAVIAGPNSLLVTVPASAAAGQTFARFRFSTLTGLAFDGLAADGEVEDYAATIQPVADLSITAVDDADPVLANRPLTYTLVVSNRGPSSASGIVVSNALPTPAALVSATASQGSCAPVGNFVWCELGTLGSGGQASVQITITSPQAGKLTNHAGVVGVEVDVNGSNNQALEVTTVVEPTLVFNSASAINVPDRSPATPYPSTIFVSGVTATVEKVVVSLNNLSHVDPADLDVLLVGPGGQHVLLMSDAGGRPGVNNVTVTFDDNATLSLPSSGVFATETYRPTNFGDNDSFAPPAPGGPYTNRLGVFRGTDPNGQWSLYILDDDLEEGGLLGGWSLTFLTLERFADVQVTQRIDPSPVALGSNLTFTVVVSNAGPADVTDVRLTNQLPAQVALVSVTAGQGQCTNDGGRIDCLVGNLLSGQSVPVTIVATASQLGPITNAAWATARELDFVTANNTSREAVVVKQVNDLAITARATPEPVLIGQQLTYTLVASNRGPNTATEVVLQHELPAGLAFVSASSSQGSCTHDGSVVSCLLGTIDTGQNASVSIVANPLQVSDVTSRSTVSAYEIELDPLNNEGLVTTTIGDIPTFTQSPQPQNVPVFSNATFTVAATGPGPISYQWLFNAAVIPGETSTTLTIPSVRPERAGAYSVVASNRFGSRTSAAAQLQLDYSAYRNETVALISSSDRWRYHDRGSDLGTAWYGTGFDDASWAEGAPLFGFEIDEPYPYPDIIRTPFELTTPTGDPIITYYFRKRFDFQNTGIVRGLVSSNLVDDGAAFYLNGSRIAELRLPAGPITYLTTAGGMPVEGQFEVLQWPATELRNGTNLFAVEVHQSSFSSSDVIFGSTLHALTVPVADLVLGQNGGPSPVAVGSNLVLTAVVSNSGPATATNVRIEQNWQGPAAFASVSSTLGSCVFDGTNAICVVPSLSAGQTATMTVTLVPSAPGGVTTAASARGAELDLELANNSASAAAVVLEPPVFLSGPTGLTITNGANVVFTAEISGAPPIALQWLRNGVELAGAISPTLSINNAQLSDAGEYRLRASNEVGIAFSAPAVLRVLVPPTISAIENQTIDEDMVMGPISFSVSDPGNAPEDLVLTLGSSNPLLVPVEKIQITGSGADRSITVRPETNQFGATTISVSVRDGEGFVITEAFELIVKAVNDLPALSAVMDSTTAEDTLWQTSVTVADVETAAGGLVLAASSSNPELVPNSNLVISGSDGIRNLVVAPITNQSGAALITLTVTDGEGGASGISFLLTVAPVNDPPEVSAIADQITVEDVPATVTVSISDIETATDSLLTGFSSSNELLLPNGGITLEGTGVSRTLRLVPAPNQYGTSLVTLTVNDGGASNNVATRSFTFSVASSNDLPTISDLGPQEIAEDGSINGLPVTIGDIETPAAALVLSANSSDQTLIPLGSILLGGSSTNRTLTITPATNRFGTATITLTVADTDGGVSADSFVVTVHPVNDPPTIEPIADQTTEEDRAVSVALAAHDVEGTSLRFAFESSNSAIVSTNNLAFTDTGTNRLLTINPVTNASGTVSITVFVSDADGATVSETFDVTVQPVNDAPTLAALPDLTLLEDAPLQSVPVQGISSGATNESELLTISAVSSNPTLIPDPVVVYTSPADAGTLELRPATNGFGTATITVTVNDGQGTNNIATRAFTIVVQSVNDLPLISAIADVSTLEDMPLGPLPFTVGDVETAVDALAITAHSSDTNLLPTGNIVFGGAGTNRTITLHPALDRFGTTTVQVAVSDADGGIATETFQFAVEAVDDPPTLDPISNVVTNEDAGLIRVSLTGISAGAFNEFAPLTVTAVSGNPVVIAPVAVLYTNPAPTGMLELRTVPNASGVATISVTVTKDTPSNNVVSRSFSVTVEAVNDLPSITDMTNHVILEDTVISRLPITVGDVETDASSLTLTASSSDQTLIPLTGILLEGTASNRTVTIMPATNQSGSAIISLTVADAEGGTSTDSFVVTVLAVNDLPVLTPIANQVTQEDVPVEVAFTARDVETSELLLTLSSSNPGLLPTNQLVLANTGSNYLLRLTPVSNAWGSATITLTASDGQGGSLTNVFDVEVHSVNDAPTLAALGNLTIQEDSGLQLVALRDISTGATNEPDTLSVTASSSNPTLIPHPSVSYTTPQSSGTLMFRPVPDGYGSAAITVRVSDGQSTNNLLERVFTVTVDPVNDLPAITDVPDVATPEDVPTAPIFFSIADLETSPESLLISSAVSNTNLIASLLFEGEGAYRTVTVIPRADAFGASTVTINVSDMDGGMASESFAINVAPVNDPPTLDPISNVLTNEDPGVIIVPLTGISSGPANESAVLTVTATSDNSDLLAPINVVYATPSASGFLELRSNLEAAGVAAVTVTVQENVPSNNIVERVFTVTLNQINDPPSITDITNRVTLENVSVGPIAFTIADAETPASNLVVAAISSNPTLLPESNIVFGGTGADRTLLLTPATNRFGTVTVTIVVSDGETNGSDSFVVDVISVNAAPTISALGDVTIAEDASSGAISFSVADDDTPAGDLLVTVLSSNPLLLPENGIGMSGGGTNRTITLAPASNQFGSAVISVLVTDGEGLTTTNTFVLNVLAVDDPPIVSDVPDLITPEDTPLTVGVMVSDVENSSDLLAVTVSSSNLALLPDANIVIDGAGTNRTLRLAPALNQFGVANVTLTVRDTNGTMASDTLQLTVTPVNDVPFISDITNRVAREDESIPPIAFTLGDVETDASNLVVTVTSSNPNLLAAGNVVVTGSGSERSLVLLPTTNQFGSATVTVFVSDGETNAFDSFTLDITPVNSIPTLTAVADVTIAEDTPTPVIPLEIGDEETPAANLVLAISSSNPVLVPQESIVIGGSGTSRTLVITPALNQSGSALISISLSDSDGESVTNQFTLTVTPVDDRPFVSSIPDRTIAEDGSLVLPLVVGDIENEAGLLVVAARSTNPALLPDSGLVFTGSGSNRTLHVVPAADQFGVATVVVSVTDTNGGASSNSFVVTVTPVNDLPIISSVPDQVTDEDAPITGIPLLVFDVETPAANLTVTTSSSNPTLVTNVSIAGSGTNRAISIVPALNQSGFADISITVRDGDGASRSTTFALAVFPANDAPVISAIADISAAEDAPIAPVAFAIGDAETAASNLVVFVESSNPSLLPEQGLVLSGTQSNRTLTMTPGANRHGSAQIVVTIYDADGLSTAQSFSLTVTPVNDPPTLSSIPNVTTRQDAQVSVPVAVSDVESAAGALVVSAASSNPSLVPAANISWGGVSENRILRMTPAPGALGTVTITVTAADPAGASNSVSFQLTINPGSEAPVILAQPQSLTVSNGVDVTFSVTASGSPPPRYQWRFNGSDLPDATNSMLVLPAVHAGNAGSYDVLVANDAGSVLSQSAMLTVNSVQLPAQVTLVATGSVWRYLDTGTNLGTAWRAAAFDDSGWPSGPAELGYGDGDEATVVSFGSNTNAKHITTYFRRAFFVADPTAYTNLLCRLRRDDGAVVYLNDVEVFRSNMPTGAVSFTTLASTAVGTADEATLYPTNISPSFLVAGNNLLAVELHQSGATSSDISFDLELVGHTRPGSQGPLDIPDQNMAEDALLSVPFTIRLPELTPFMVTVGSDNQSLIADANLVVTGIGTNRMLSITPSPNQSGSARVTVNVTNSTVSLSETFVVTVAAVNDPPTLDPINHHAALRSTAQAIRITGITSGATNEAQTLTVTAASSDNLVNPTVSYTNGQSMAYVRFTPPNQSGSAVVTVSVNDGGASNNTVSRTFTVYVRQSSQAPPTISNIPDQITNEDTPTAAIPFTVFDSVTPAASLVLLAYSSDPLLVPTNGFTFGGSGSNRTVVVTPAPNRFGTATISISVADGGSGLTNDSFVLTVAPVNDAPVFSAIANQTIGEDSSLAVSFAVSDVDTSWPAISVSATSSNPLLFPSGSLAVSGNGTRFLAGTPARDATGNATITLSADDGTGGLASTNFAVTVTNRNDSPTISDILGQTTMRNSSISNIAFTVGDPDNAPETLVVSAESSNPTLLPVSNISFAGTGANRLLALQPAQDQSGSALITLTVRDADGLTARDSFTLVVLAGDDPPTLDPIADVLLRQGTPPRAVPLTGINSTPRNGNQTIAVSAISDSPNVVADPMVSYTSPASTGTLLLSPNPATNGTATITVSVNDGMEVVSRMFKVTIDGNPHISAIADQQMDEDSAPTTVSFSVSDPETPANALLVAAAWTNPGLLPEGTVSLAGAESNRTITITPAPNQFGSALISVSVTDTNGNSSTNIFALNVNAVNDAPALAPLADISVIAGSGLHPISLSGINAGAPNEFQELLVTAQTDNPALFSTLNVNYTSPASVGTLNLAPAAGTSGVAVVTVSVSDRQRANHLATRSFVVTSIAPNERPQISDIADQSVAEDSTIGPLAFSIADGENPPDALTLSVSSSNPSLIPSSNIVLAGTGANRTLTLSPLTNAFGSSIITVTVTDTGGLSTSDSLLVTVIPVNDPPTITAIADQVIAEDTLLGPLAFTISDVETAAGDLTVSANSSNPTLLPTANITLAGSGAARSVSLAPAPNTSGTSVITLTVRDGGGIDVSQSFAVTVLASNDPPQISDIGPQVTNEDASLAPLPFTVGDIETPASNLTLSALSSDSSVVPVTNIVFGGSGANRTITLSPAPNAFGTSLVTIVVTDAEGLSVSTSFTVTVQAVNDPPQISDLLDQTIVEDAQLGPISFTIGDLETAAGDLAVSAIASDPSVIPPANFVLGGAGTSRTLVVQPALNASGSVVITLVVTDAGGLTASNSFVVTVLPLNDPPTISDFADLTINEDTGTGAIPFTIGDVETAAADLLLNFESSNEVLVQRFVGFGGSGSNRTITIFPHPHASGTTILTVSVREPGGARTSKSFVLTVNPVDDPPEMSGIPDVVIDEDASARLHFTVNDIDDPATPITLVALSSDQTLLPNANIGILINQYTASLTIQPATNRFGTASVTVTATDPTGLSSSRTFSVTVNPVNDPPVVSQVSDQSVSVGSATGPLPFSVSDLENPPSDLIVSAQSSNPSLVGAGGLTLGGSGGSRTITVSPAPGQFGLAVITLTVSDPQAASTTTTFEVVVNQTSGPPVIALQPQAQSVVADSEVMFRVVASGPGPLGYQWRRDGFDLPGETNSVLRIVSAQPGDNGEYTVRVTNGAGSVVSNPARLTVYVCPTLIVSRTGSTLTLSFLTVTGQSYAVEYQDVLGGPWSTLAPAVAGNGGVLTTTDTVVPGQMRFYRVRSE